MPTLSRRSVGELIAAAAAAVPAASLLTQTAAAAEPNMEKALRDLESAHNWLERATPNKGGHRERAIGLVEQAISEVRAGMAFRG
jgi:hypothetical protein